MAGIFDMFGGNDPEKSRGLLAAAAQILQASGPSRTPTSLGQILGGGINAYQDTMDKQRVLGQQEQLRGLQIREGESELEMKAAQRKRAQELLDFQTTYGKSRGGQPQAASMPAPQSADTMFRSAIGGGMAPQQPAMGDAAPAPAAAPAGGSRNALVQERLQYAQALRDSGYSAEANAAEEQALKLQPKVKGWEKVQQDGKVMFAPFFEDGTNGAPVPLEVAEKLEAINRGGTTELTNAYTGATVRSMTNSLSPAAAAADALGYANLGLSKQRFDFDKKTQSGGGRPPPGYRWGPNGSQEAIPGGPATKHAMASEGERKASTLLQRLQFSEAQLEAAVRDAPGAATPSLLAQGLRGIGAEAAANSLTGESRQKVDAAQLDILDAALTLGTGAAYTKEQLEGYRKSYFPQIGDAPGTVKDKQARLNNVIEAAKTAAGRAAPAQPSVPAPRAAAPAAGGKTVSLSDIAATARASGRSTKEVTAALRAKGYTIGGQ